MLDTLDTLFSSPWGILAIFLLRIVDVSLSMMRMLFAVRGMRLVAAAMGFFEVLIWIIVVGNALQHLDSVYHIIAYAGGFATGNYVGVSLEARFALGVNAVRAVFRSPEAGGKGAEAALALREQGYAVTELPGRGRHGSVDILNIIVQRRHVPHVLTLLQETDDTSFVTVQEVRSTTGGFLPSMGRPAAGDSLSFRRLRMFRN